jgi:hypothetical protein
MLAEFFRRKAGGTAALTQKPGQHPYSFSYIDKNSFMKESLRDVKTEIAYKGRTIAITTVQTEMLSNGWFNFGVQSDDDTFVEVFGKNPIPFAIKPKQEFKTEYDFFQNTPEQVELVKEIWYAIQREYF